MVSALLALILFGVVLLLGVVMARTHAQHSQDDLRQQYELTFPRDVTMDSVTAFLRSLGGMKTSVWHRFNGVPTVVFEVMADTEGIHHRILVPVKMADYVIGQLSEHLPGVRRTAVRGLHGEHWEHGIELGMSSTRKPLHITHPELVTKTLLGSLSPVQDNQALLMQWVVTPARPELLDVNDPSQREKQKDRTFLAVGRLAARAETKTEAKRLLHRMYMALGSTKAHGVAFIPRTVPAGMLRQRIERRAASLTFPCLLTVNELASVIALPAGHPNVPGLPHGASRNLAADRSIPETGLVIGTSNYPGNERPLALAPLDLTKHLHIVGPTGVGKSTLIVNLASQQIKEGYGVAVFDPKGDLVADLADRMPPGRDVILLDPTDSEFPIGFNVLAGGDPYLVTDQIMAVFDRLYDIYRMPRTADILRAGILTLAHQGYALLDLIPLLASGEAGKDFRSRVTRGLSDRALRNFWDWFDAMRPGEQADATAPVLRRLRPFELRPSLRATLGQVESGFDLGEVLSEGKVLLVSLSKGQLGEETSALFGALIVTKLWQQVQTRSALPTADRTPFFCHIDEFQNYLHLPMSIMDVLAEARGYGFGMSLAHQNLGQLPPQLRDAVMANARSKIIFQASAGDASALARELSPYVDAQDIQNLGAYEIIARLSIGGQVTPPATASTAPMPRPGGTARAVRANSRQRYGRSIAAVEAEMAERQRGNSKPHKKPSIGWEEES